MVEWGLKDKSREIVSWGFDDAPVSVLSPDEEEQQIKSSVDISERKSLPIEVVDSNFDVYNEEEQKQKKINSSINRYVAAGMGGFSPFITRETAIDIPVRPTKIAKEIAKGIARFAEAGVGGTFGGTAYDWLGQFIEQGGYAVDYVSKFGTKNKDQIYNPFAESIIATGQNISKWGKESRKAWAEQAAFGWEALDPTLKKSDPVSYGAGRLSEGVASSGLSVLAVYLSGGAAAPALLNKGLQINRGLVALSTMSAAGGFEHAQSQDENFFWSTVQGLADGGIEYAMETSFLEGIGKGKGVLTAGFKEGGEEFFTGMLQNTRASLLENENKGMTAYDGAKNAIIKSLKQSPWEVAAGFIGGTGIQGGANLTNIVKNWKSDVSVDIPTTSAEGGIKLAPPTEEAAKKPTEPAPAPQPAAEPTITPVEGEVAEIRQVDGQWQIKHPESDKFTNLAGEFETKTADQVIKRLKELPANKGVEFKLIPAKAEAKPKKARDILGGVDPITQINKALTDAVEIRPRVEKERKAELRKRVGAAAGALKSSLTKRKISAEEAIGRSTGLLKGPLSDARFSSIRDVMEDASPGAVDEAFRSIGDNKKLKYFEIIETKEAFAKLIDGMPITLRQVDMIKKQFGIEMGEIAKQRAEKSSLSDRLWNFWRAGLLTGIKTSMLNTTSNLTHAVTETTADLIAAPVDILISKLTGQKREIGFTWKGIPSGVKEGAVKGWNYLWTGISERDIGKKFDYVPVNYGNSKIGKAVQVYVETWFHLMGAEDQPFFYSAMSRVIRSQAIAEGRNQKLKGQEFKDFVEKTRLAPTGEMLENAAKDAEQAVFQNRTVLGDIASHIQKAPVIRWVVPFSRTPSAVAMQIINYTPIGTMKEVAEQIHKGEFDKRLFSKAIGRSVVGTPALAIGALLLAKGLMTLDFPEGERERKLWELEGKKPFAIKIGSKWRSAFVLGPVGNVLIIGAYFQKAITESGSPSEAIVTAMSGGGKSFTEQTFVIGMSRAIDAIKDPERSFDRFFTGMAGSFVPTIVADVARATDYTKRTYKGPWQGIVNRIPVARTTLEERLDVFGQALPRYGGNPLEVMIDASRPVKIRQDVVVDEIRRLWDKNVRVAPTQLGNRDGYESLTQEENAVLWRRAGEATYQSLFELIKKRSYLRKGDEIKGKMIEREVKQAKDSARAEAAKIKLNQGSTMQELKESGLVTSDVERIMR